MQLPRKILAQKQVKINNKVKMQKLNSNNLNLRLN